MGGRKVLRWVPMLNVAFLGLGSIGRPMAARIAGAGFPLTVWNRTAHRADAFAQDFQVVVASSAADAVRGADLIATCMSTSTDVVEVFEGGVYDAVKPGAVVLDLTSGDPATSRRIAERL